MAIEDYGAAICLNPGDADSYLNRGLAFAYREEYDLAIADYDTAIHISPEYALVPFPLEDALYRICQATMRNIVA